MWSILSLCLLCLVFPHQTKSLHEIQCRDPDAGGTAQNKDRKFLILGAATADAGGAGIGNLLIFYPAAFYFAAFTGRDIIISDKSALGEMCQIVQCGFPFVSQMSLAYPKILNEDTLYRVEDVRFSDFQAFMDEKKDITANVVRAGGYLPKSEWWIWYNTTVHCVKKITGCDLGDIMCAERHAYQRLVRGPFKTTLTLKEEDRIHGVPQHMKHAILTLPHQYAPRLDAAVHLRTQFHHFEQSVNISDPAYRKEVDDWLNSTECNQVFNSMKNKLEERVNELRPVTTADTAVSGGTSTSTTPTTTSSVAASVTAVEDPIYIYLAADNEDVKDAFITYLSTNNPTLFNQIKIMRVETKFIFHVKNLAKMKSATDNEGLLDLVFDWYALSLANHVYAWRKGSTNMVSSFVHSAQKVSGTTERTDNGKGTGIGTRGYQLIRDRRGNMKFDLFWAYTFIEDYQI